MTGKEKDIAELVEAANAVMDAYGRVLEQNSDALVSKSLLPCDEEQVKSALLFVLEMHHALGSLDEATIACIGGSYVRLSNFVDDDLVARWVAWNESLARFKSAPDAEKRDLLVEIKESGGPVSAALQRSAEMALQLSGEFEAECKRILSQGDDS